MSDEAPIIAQPTPHRWHEWIAHALIALAQPLPEEAIERTQSAPKKDAGGNDIRGTGTRKGYDTTGYRYQYVVDRLNQVLGLDGWRSDAVYKTEEYTTRNGAEMYEVTAHVTIEIGFIDIDGKWIVLAPRKCHGGHASLTEADALKGAFTNGFKKTAALFGVGAQAYRGTIDDDNTPRPEAPGEATRGRAKPTPAKNTRAGSDTKPAPKKEEPPVEKKETKKIEKTGADAKVDEAARIVARMGELVKSLGKERCDAITKHLRPMKGLEERRKALALLEEAAKSAGADASPELLDQLATRADMSAEDLDAWAVELYGRKVKDLDAGFRANLAGRLEEAVAKLEAQLSEPGSDG